jgi:hypothetical protein
MVCPYFKLEQGQNTKGFEYKNNSKKPYRIRSRYIYKYIYIYVCVCVCVNLQLGFNPVAVVQQYNRQVTHITQKQSTNTIQKHNNK